MTRAHLALGYLALPASKWSDECYPASGLALLDIEARFHDPLWQQRRVIDATPDLRGDPDAVGWMAARAIAAIPVVEPDPAADVQVFDYGVQALTGWRVCSGSSYAAGLVERHEEPYRLRLPGHHRGRELLTCPIPAAPELIRQKVSEELALWALGLYDPTTETDV
jgi:hypothetical protein